MNRKFSQEEEVRLKALARGPLGTELIKFPLKFATSILIGDGFEAKPAENISNGTGTLLIIDGEPIAVTCYHVVNDYRVRKKERDTVLFQIGNLILDPLNHLIAEDKELDLAIICLKGISNQEVLFPGEPCGNFFNPTNWPPLEPEDGNPVSFAGYPGILREKLGGNELSFNGFTGGCIFVTSTNERHFTIQLERQFWITKSEEGKNPTELFEFGGMSGGPVFIERTLPSGFHQFDLIGIIQEFSPTFDLLFATHARHISDLLIHRKGKM